MSCLIERSWALKCIWLHVHKDMHDSWGTAVRFKQIRVEPASVCLSLPVSHVHSSQLKSCLWRVKTHYPVLLMKKANRILHQIYCVQIYINTLTQQTSLRIRIIDVANNNCETTHTNQCMICTVAHSCYLHTCKLQIVALPAVLPRLLRYCLNLKHLIMLRGHAGMCCSVYIYTYMSVMGRSLALCAQP